MSREVVGAIAVRGTGETGGVYDAGGAPTHRFDCYEARPDDGAKNWDGTRVATGSMASLGVTPLQNLPRIPINAPADDVSLPFLMASFLGLDAVTTPTGATNARRHRITGVAAAVELKTVPIEVHMVDKATTTLGKTNRFRGGICDTIQVSGDTSKANVDVSANFAASGTVEAGADISSGMIAPGYSPFKHNNIFLFMGTAFTLASTTDLAHGSAPTAPELTSPLTHKCRAFQFSGNNGVNQEAGHSGSISTVATDMKIGQRVCRLSITIPYDETNADCVALMNGTSDGTFSRSLSLYCVSNTKIEDVTTDYPYSWRLLAPLVFRDGRITWSNDTQLGVRLMTVPLLLCDDGTNGEIIFDCYNDDTTDYMSGA